jgi:hypothetical protein
VGVGEHALGSVGGRLGFEAAAAHPSHRDPGGGGEVGDAVEDGGPVEVLGHPDVDGGAAPGGEELGDGLPALDLLAP